MNRRAYMVVLAAAATYKSIEHLAVFGLDLWGLIGGPLLAGALVIRWRPRAGMAIIAAAAFWTNLTPAYRNHLHLLMLLALTMALFTDERTVRWVLRCQLSIMYGYAAVAKLNPDWLAGDALEAMTWPGSLLPGSLLVTVAVGTIVLEGGLAVGVWLRWGGWFWLAVMSHVSFLVFTQTHIWDLGRLATFGVLTLATWLYATPSARAANQRSYEAARVPESATDRRSDEPFTERDISRSVSD